MQLRLKVKVDFKALCLISALLGVLILICAAFYIYNFNGDYYGSKRCEWDEKYREVKKLFCTYRWYLTIAVGSIALILSVLQIILALLLAFARPLSNSKCYVICHLVLGVIALVPFVLLVVIITQAPMYCFRLEEALFTFLIIDMFYCFLSAIVMCACGESLGCTRGKNLTLNNLSGGGGGGGRGGYNQGGGGGQSHASPNPDRGTSPTPTAEPSQQHTPQKSEVKQKKKRSKKPSKPQQAENAAETKKSVETTKSNGAKKKNKKKRVEPQEEF